MKVTETLYNITLNTKEIHIIETALTAAYNEIKEQYRSIITEDHTPHDEEILISRRKELKEIMDGFLKITGNLENDT